MNKGIEGSKKKGRRQIKRKEWDVTWEGKRKGRVTQRRKGEKRGNRNEESKGKER